MVHSVGRRCCSVHYCAAALDSFSPSRPRPQISPAWQVTHAPLAGGQGRARQSHRCESSITWVHAHKASLMKVMGVEIPSPLHRSGFVDRRRYGVHGSARDELIFLDTIVDISKSYVMSYGFWILVNKKQWRYMLPGGQKRPYTFFAKCSS